MRGESSPLDTASFVGKSVAVLGITGSGKTNTAAVLIEELLTAGFPLFRLAEYAFPRLHCRHMIEANTRLIMLA